MDKKKKFQLIPGVGENISRDFVDLGYTEPADLQSEDPEQMYRNLIKLRGRHVDRCVLYVFRCAVYFATTPSPDRELLQWWKWKDER